MKSVNLLPGWYRLQQRRHKNFRVHLAVMVVLGGLMVGARVLAQEYTQGLEARRDALFQKAEAIGNPEQQLLKYQAELKGLQERRLTCKELGNTVPMSAVVQQLQNSMTPGMALSNVTVETHSEPVPGSGYVGDLKNPPRYHDMLRLTVNGISPSNDKVATFIDDLARNKLFSDVTLDFTHNAELQRVPSFRFIWLRETPRGLPLL